MWQSAHVARGRWKQRRGKSRARQTAKSSPYRPIWPSRLMLRLLSRRLTPRLGASIFWSNNAGSSPGGVLDYLTEEHWAQSLQLKFMGYVRCLKHVLPIMQKQRRGRVVNLIGNDGVKPSYWEIALGAANAAGQNLTLALAAQYGKDNISFVAVNPGPVRTERWAGLVDARLIRLPRAAFRWGALANARRSPALSPTSLLIWRILLTAR